MKKNALKMLNIKLIWIDILYVETYIDISLKIKRENEIKDTGD